MRAALRLAAAVAAVAAACTLNPLSKDACTITNDCPGGYVCVSNHCMPNGGGGTSGGGTSGGGTAGGGHAGGGHAGGGNSGHIGTNDAGPDVTPPPPRCLTSGVTACPTDAGAPACEENVCGGLLWSPGVSKTISIQYKIEDTQSQFSPSDLGAIRAAARAWMLASSGFVTFQECAACGARFISVQPGDIDGVIVNPGNATVLQMPVAANGGRVSPHRIAHQWGHVVGLSHTYERADRDRYMGFDQDLWCPSNGPGLPPRCTGSAASGPFPGVATGTFGVFDEKSKMNDFRGDGVCGAEEPDQDSDEPTIGDVSAAAELFSGATMGGWSPFLPIGQLVSPTQPLDYQLAPDVDPTGSPAIAELDYASPEIFVRGTDDTVYRTKRDLAASPPDWTKWDPVVGGVDADPAVVFATDVVATNPTLFLAVRLQADGKIYLRARKGDDAWGYWTGLAAPPAGAASAPALASESPSSLAIVVRGGDGLIYWLNCTDANAMQPCATSATGQDAWKALPPPSAGIFVSKPSAIWPMGNNIGLIVAAVRDDRKAQLITHVDGGGSDWLPAGNVMVNDDLAPDDQKPGVAITTSNNPTVVTFLARNQQRLLVSDTQDQQFPSIGGVLVSPPGAVTVVHQTVRTDVAAIIDDHGHPGVWWRFQDGDYAPACDAPGSCTECGP
jgi:hypothetical protein